MMNSRWNLNRGRSRGAPVALASNVNARAIDVRRLLHCLALGAAVLARCCQARANRVGTLLGFCRGHFFLLSSHQERTIQALTVTTSRMCFCTEMNTRRNWSHATVDGHQSAPLANVLLLTTPRAITPRSSRGPRDGGLTKGGGEEQDYTVAD
jgi:hypothetical protein